MLHRHDSTPRFLPPQPPLPRVGLRGGEGIKGGGNLEGENFVKLYQEMILAVSSIGILVGITLSDLNIAIGQSKEVGRDPFLLPPGVHLLSKTGAPSGVKGLPPRTEPDRGVKAILIADHIRLALIDRHIVTVGDSIRDEKVLEINKDRVILGKGEQKRTLLLSQSPIPLTVEKTKGEIK